MRRFIATVLISIGIMVGAGAPAHAVLPDEVLDDPALESRARTLSAELRCLVCQNQSIDDSDAPLARDLRVLVRERLVAGDSDEQVMDFVVSRYGEFVLLKPSFSAQNALLWAAPLVILLIGGVVLIISIRNRRRPATAGLSTDEEAKLEKILQSRDRET